MLERDFATAGGTQVVPGFMGQPLHVVRKVAGEVDNRGADARLRADAASGETGLDELGEQWPRNLVEPHHRPCLVEGPPWSNHLVHQAGFGTGEDVSDFPLLLRGGAERMLDRSAVEAFDSLKLVERHDHRALSLRGETAGKRKNLVREP